MTPEQASRFKELYEEMYSLCGGIDPFSYARSREINMAATFGHTVSDTYSGADAYDIKGNWIEYKSTIAKIINATYNGISVQDTWEEQERYIIEDKIGKYPYHYYARFADGKIVEAWKLTGEKVLEILLPKIKKQYPKKKNGNAKDPRIGVTVSQKEIKENGVRII
jgi:hypothetical protein